MPWSAAPVIGLLATSAVLLAVFVMWERRVGNERAILPTTIWRRSEVGACLEGFFTQVAYYIGIVRLCCWLSLKIIQHISSRAHMEELAYLR